jgi:hypothetical protein
MYRLVAVAAFAASPLLAQGQPLTPKDSTQIRAAAESVVPLRDKNTPTQLSGAADTATATVFVSTTHARIVRLARRKDEWVVVPSDTTQMIFLNRRPEDR